MTEEGRKCDDDIENCVLVEWTGEWVCEWGMNHGKASNIYIDYVRVKYL